MAPLYPLWLSLLVRLSGPRVLYWLLGVTNAALRAVGCVLLWRLAKRVFGVRAAGRAVARYLLDPWEWVWSGIILKEALGVPLFLLSSLALAELAAAPGIGRAAAAGGAVGLATLCRYPSSALSLAALWLLVRR